MSQGDLSKDRPAGDLPGQPRPFPPEVLEAAVDAAGLGIWAYDPATGVLTASDGCKRAFGRRPDEPLSYGELVAAIHPDDMPHRDEAVARALETGVGYAIEYRAVWPDGSLHWIESRGRRLSDARGRRLVGVTIDRTERHVAEAALRESEERFRLIADSAPAPMWITNPAGARRFVNHAYQDFLGYDFEAACALDWHVILHPDDLARVNAESQAGEASLQPFALEARYRRQDGVYRWMRSVSQPQWGPLGEHAGFIGIAFDVTEIRLGRERLEQANVRLEGRVTVAVAEKLEAEAALLQSQRLEAVGQLTSGVAHDFNNLLTVVLGNVRQLEKTAADEVVVRRLSTIREAAERGAKLTGQLLAFARRQRLEPRPVDLNDTVIRMGELLRGALGGGVTVEMRLGGGLPPAFIDPTQLELVILNLAINGRDAMDGRGRLVIETAHRTLGEPQRPEEPAAGDYVMLCVQDEGCGMSETVREKAFEPFFTTKDIGKGSGLGLSQVLGLAKQSEGGVRIDTVPGQGAAVCLYLPPTRAEAAATVAAPSGASHRGDGSRILVVDDDPAVREITAAALAEAGYEVIEAGGGREALERLDDDPGIELVLMDFAMPGMNGAQAARQTRTVRPDLPILFLTGHADVPDLKDTPEGEILLKPFRGEYLVARVGARLAAARGTPTAPNH